ncbi:MAG: site-specific DNA-methyltransferase [Syntrophomonas sp.]
MEDIQETLDLSSGDIIDDKKQQLLNLFPEANTEGGKIDFERLKLALGEAVDAGRERYGMNWPGKAECFKTIQTPSMGTLLPCPEDSINFETTGNLIFEGDNLEVLKLLQKSYLGKVKMIYIDPPYNTGNDFIYPDNYTESLQTYLEYTGQVDAEGRKFNTNTDTDGRFHSKWLNMMYPRLYLARNLLRDDGVIFISIDDNEVNNLRGICNEIFGEENFICTLIWEKGRKNDAKLVSVGHDYLILFAKNKRTLSDNGIIWREAKPGAAEIQAEYVRLRQKYGTDNQIIQKKIREFYFLLPKNHPSKKLSRYGNVDDNGVWRDDNMSWPGGGGPMYEVIHPITGKACAIPEGGWRYSTPEKMKEMINKGKVIFRDDHTEPPIRKTYLVRADDDDYENSDEDVGIQVAGSYFYRSALQATNSLTALFNEKIFENPKDHEVLMRWFKYVGLKSKDDLILDFFAGSGTTAHAVLNLNKQDGGNRKFILVQLPEPTGRDDYPTIAEITKERVRRVIKKMNDEDAGKLDLEGIGQQDRGFRVFKLAESNFKPWDAGIEHDAQALAKQLEFFVEHILEERTTDDLLYEILLKSGFELAVRVEEINLVSKTVYSVLDGALFICLERELTLEFIRAMAEKKPERIVCLDEGFAGNDQLKANAVQVFKTKGIPSFKTV